MGFFYLMIGYGRFYKNIALIPIHFLILAFWIVNTFVVMMLVREILIRTGVRLLYLPTVVVPAVSFFFLYVIYISGIIGNLTWGETPTYPVVLHMILDLFSLADNFELPSGLVIGFLVLPLAGFTLTYLGRVREMVIWHFVTRESLELSEPKQRRVWVLSFIAAWVLMGAVYVVADPASESKVFLNHDPIIAFFKTRRNFFPMTKERIFWAQRDKRVTNSFSPTVPKVHNVFLFVVDALRSDHLPLYGYPRPLTPHLDRFLKDHPCQKVPMTLSNGLDTITGLQCLLTAKGPTATSPFCYTLPDYLSDQSFKTHLILAGDHSWQLRHKAFGKKIDLFYDGSEHPGPGGVCDDELVENRVKELPSYDGGYHFFYIHLISVHQLALLKEPFQRYKPIRNILNLPIVGLRTGDEIKEMEDMYDDRVLQMDDYLGRILALFAQKGYLKDCVGVFTADHGQLIGENQHYGHGYYAAQPAMRIPLVFFGSRPLPKGLQANFGLQIDIAPTLVDMAGLEVPNTWEGHSLLKPSQTPWSFHVSCIHHPGQEAAVIYHGSGRIFEFVRALDAGAKRDKVFDLAEDPGEKVNLVGATKWAPLTELRAQWDQHFRKF